MSFRRGTFLKFSLCIWAICLGYTGGFFAWELFGQRANFAEKRTQELEHHLLLTRDRLNDPRALVEVLRHGLRSGDIDFFGWKQNGQWISFEGHRPESLDHAREGKVTRDDDVAVAQLSSGAMELYFGSGLGWKARAREVVNHRFSFVLKEILFFALALMVMAVFFFQEMTRSFASRAEPRRDPKPKTPVEPKALREARPVRASPVLDGTLVFFAAETAESLTAIAPLEKKNESLAELAHRYGGREVDASAFGQVYFFPDPLLALAAARDKGETAYLTQGQIYGTDKKFYGKALSDGWRQLALLPSPGLWSAKKVPGCTEKLRGGLHELTPSLGLAPVLSEARSGDFRHLTLFRSDADLTAILEALKSDWPRDHYLGALAQLRSFHCLSTMKPLAEAYTSLLRRELAQKDTYRLSGVLALATHLFAPSAVSREMERLFLQVLALPDRRTKANAIEVFIHFFPDREIPELKPYLRDMDNRVSANALVKAALERFDDKVVRKIDERLRGGSVAHVASALYALGEIAIYYRRTDPLYLSTKIGFLEICGRLPEWAVHPNLMVKRQALVAARKLGDEKLDLRLKQIFEKGGDPALDDLFGSIYGWHQRERAA